MSEETQPLVRLDPRPERSALLVVDVQRDFCDPTVSPLPLDAVAADIESAVTETIRLTGAARELGVTVVWLRLERQAGKPWVASDWLWDRAPDGWSPCREGTPGADFYRVEPAPADLVVTKSRHSGFIGTGLEAMLRDRGVEWVAVCGITTDCCVEATVRDAYQADLPPVVVSDSSAAHDRGRHEGALEIMSAHVARIATTDEILRHWQAAQIGSRSGLLEGFALPAE